jgi:4-amino-4-deoxy-L-arabinose transferase-like glycosyltransferase
MLQSNFLSAAPQFDPAATDNPGSHRRQVIVESTFVVLLIAAAFLLRLWALSEVHFWDETVYLQNAEVICCAKANYSELDSRPPLLSLIFAAAFLLWHHVYAASVAAALLNALGPAFLYFSGRMIAGRIAAAIAALLLAFSPFFVGVFPPGFVSDATGNSLLSDSPAVTLIVLAFWLLLRALRRPTSLRFASAGFVLALAVLMRFASLSTVGVLSLLVFVDVFAAAADRWWNAALACGAGFAAGMGPNLCWSRFRYGGFLTTLHRGWGNFEGPGESPFFYLKDFGNIFSWITLAGLALWIGGWAWEKLKWKAGDGQREDRHRENHLVSAVERTAEKRSRRIEAFLWLWAVALLLFFSALRHKEPRYAMPLAPPLFLLAGIGLSVLVRGRQTLARIAGTALLVGALAYTFLPVRQRFESPFVDDEVSEDMQVSDFLHDNVPPATVLYSNFNYPVFAWYTNLPVHRLPESGPALYDALNRLPGDGILIAYKASDEIAEPRLEWLDSNPHFRRFREFPALVLYEYRGCSGPSPCQQR